MYINNVEHVCCVLVNICPIGVDFDLSVFDVNLDNKSIQCQRFFNFKILPTKS